jgi:Spy/CpxP family protein refolding chaperone
MKTKLWMATVLAAALMAAPAVAQRGPRMGGPGGPMMGDPAQRLSRLATVLDLTEAQKTAAKAIFDNAKTQAQPLGTQMRDAREAVQAAVKENKPDAEIDTLTARTGTLMGQMAAIHAKAQRAFRQLLTQQQREKLDALRPQMRPNRFRGGQ